MMWSRIVLIWGLLFGLVAWGQQTSSPPGDNQSRPTLENPPRSDSAPDSDNQLQNPSSVHERPGTAPSTAQSSEESSSRNLIIDLSPPPGDSQAHPDSDISSASGSGGDDITELRPWNPHRAEKDIEVGDYYFKEKNYRAAESRYREALLYKPDDAVATYRLAETLEKNGNLREAVQYYSHYLKILPHGPYAFDARKARERLQAQLER